MSIKSVMPSYHLVLCRPLLLLLSIFPSIRVFSDESALRIRWPKYWNFSFSLRYIGCTQAHHQLLLPKTEGERVLGEFERQRSEFGGMDRERDTSLKRQKDGRLAEARCEAGEKSKGVSRTRLYSQG